MESGKPIMLVIFYCLIFLFSLQVSAQKIEHYKDLCTCPHTAYNSLDEWRNIIDTVTFKNPYTSVIHLGIKKMNDDREHYSTASFISKNFIITAMHCLMDSAHIEYIDLKVPDIKSDKWVRLYKDDFQIYYYAPRIDSPADDIALLKIKNIKNGSLVYRSYFTATDFNNDKHDSLQINISGFPCLRFCYTANCMDTLVNRHADKTDMKINAAGTCMQIPVVTCPGDSGGPVWYGAAERYFIIGIAQSSDARRAGFTEEPDHTIAVLMNADKIKWIQSVINKNKIKK